MSAKLFTKFDEWLGGCVHLRKLQSKKLPELSPYIFRSALPSWAFELQVFLSIKNGYIFMNSNNLWFKNLVCSYIALSYKKYLIKIYNRYPAKCLIDDHATFIIDHKCLYKWDLGIFL